MSDSDGIEEALEQTLRMALMTAARAGEHLARLREASNRKREAASRQEAAELTTRLNAQQADARSVYGQTRNSEWWDQAEPQDLVRAYETAHAWRDHDPQAQAAITKMNEEVKTRYDIDLPANPGDLNTALNEADQNRSRAERDRQDGAGLLADAAAADRDAERERDQGNPVQAQGHQNQAADLDTKAGYSYDSAERRDADAAEWSKTADKATVEARRQADTSQARPASEATRPQVNKPKRAAAQTPARQRDRSLSR